MRKINILKSFFAVLILLTLCNGQLLAQTTISDVLLKGMDGKEYSLVELSDNNYPTAVIFWATWCKPCIEELDNIAEYYSEWEEEVNFNLVAICVDDSRSSSSIRSFVLGKDWPFTVLIDGNQDLKRAMNVTDIPHYYIFDGEGKMVKRHTGYLPGDEEILFEEIKEVNNEK